jgi:hypothetical protein
MLGDYVAILCYGTTAPLADLYHSEFFQGLHPSSACTLFVFDGQRGRQFNDRTAGSRLYDVTSGIAAEVL